MRTQLEHNKRTAIVGDKYMYILNNVYLECWLSSEYCSKKVEYLFTRMHIY
jgi:hypothetical protein